VLNSADRVKAREAKVNDFIIVLWLICETTQNCLLLQGVSVCAVSLKCYEVSPNLERSKFKYGCLLSVALAVQTNYCA
jgi:hypothetical protein